MVRYYPVRFQVSIISGSKVSRIYLKSWDILAKIDPNLRKFSFWGCSFLKMTIFQKFLQILSLHVVWHQKNTTHFRFEGTPILPLPLLYMRLALLNLSTLILCLHLDCLSRCQVVNMYLFASTLLFL